MNKQWCSVLIMVALGISGCSSPRASSTDTNSTKTGSNDKILSLSICDDMTNLYFCDDFNSQDISHWQPLASKGGHPDGFWDIPKGSGYLRYTAGSSGGEILLASKSVLKSLPSDGNYFIEAKIRPRQNSTTYNKQLYLIGRWQSTGNWYGGGLNLQNSSSSTKVEATISQDGSITRPLQVNKTLELGAKGGNDGTWYTTRFVMLDNQLTVYVDGKSFGTYTNKLYTSPGNFGIWTNNRSFEIDYIKVGNPSIKPVQMTLDYDLSSWSGVAGGDALTVNVAALQSDGKTADTFSVASSDNRIVSDVISGTVVTLTPLAKGVANVTFTSGANPSLTRTIGVIVESPFVMPTTAYGNLSKVVTPAPNATEQYTDTTLSIAFDNKPTLGHSGQIRVYRLSDDKLVDTIAMSGEVDALGYNGQKNKRYINYTPVTVNSDSVTIKLHSDALDYGTNYYAVISAGVISGATLNGKQFSGLGSNSHWIFTTKAKKTAGSRVTVSKKSGADFATVQGALNYVMKNISADAGATIIVKPGAYDELLYLKGMNNITIKGDGNKPGDTVIQYDNYETLNSGTGTSETSKGSTPGGGRSLFLAEGDDLLTIVNLTLKNTHQRQKQYSNQAETINFKNSKGRLIAYKAHFISEQDTLLLSGYNWFYNTLIAGNVDFIWGYSHASLFENSEIRSLGDSKNGTNVKTSGGYVLQARVPNINDVGFVFINDEFTSGKGPTGNTIKEGSTYLARSGGSSRYYDNIIMINNRMGSHIATIGWAGEGVNRQPASDPKAASARAGWREYGSDNEGGDAIELSQRHSAYILSTDHNGTNEVSPYTTRAKIFSAIGWKPEVPKD